MILLLAFAFLAGAATAITPCVLPVLPALLSASGTGGRRRPIGIVCGLTLTHVITIVGIASVVDGVGVGDGDAADGLDRRAGAVRRHAARPAPRRTGSSCA